MSVSGHFSLEKWFKVLDWFMKKEFFILMFWNFGLASFFSFNSTFKMCACILPKIQYLQEIILIVFLFQIGLGMLRLCRGKVWTYIWGTMVTTYTSQRFSIKWMANTFQWRHWSFPHSRLSLLGLRKKSHGWLTTNCRTWIYTKVRTRIKGRGTFFVRLLIP